MLDLIIIVAGYFDSNLYGVWTVYVQTCSKTFFL